MTVTVSRPLPRGVTYLPRVLAATGAAVAAGFGVVLGLGAAVGLGVAVGAGVDMTPGRSWRRPLPPAEPPVGFVPE